MEEIHRRNSKKKRKHSLGDGESGCDIPKTKKNKRNETKNRSPSYPDVESGDVPHPKKQKQKLHDKDGIDEKGIKSVEDKRFEIPGEEAHKKTKKKKSKNKKDKAKENSALKHGIVETTAQGYGLNSCSSSNGRELKKMPDERAVEIQKGDSDEVKGKKKSKKKARDKESPRTLDQSLHEEIPKNLQTASPDGAKKNGEESKPGQVKMIKDQEGDDIETTGKKKSKRKKAHDKPKNSLGTVDCDLVESTAKNLQINGLDIDSIDSSKEVDAKKSTSTKKQKKKKKEKTDKQAGKIDEKKSDQSSVSRNDRALTYLHTWNSDKASWKFNKMNQVQLFHMMYDPSLVNDKDFQILLLYLAGMKGQAKEITHNQALKLVDGDSENEEEISKEKERRAREIVQVLS